MQIDGMLKFACNINASTFPEKGGLVKFDSDL